MQSLSKLNTIQALRGVAALLVVLHHIGGQSTNGLFEGGYYGAIWKQGYAGVDLFFVISGFIMIYVTQFLRPAVSSAGAFLYARFTRVYPLWWIYLSLAVIYFTLVYGQPAPPDQVPPDAIGLYVRNSYLLLPDKYGLPVLSVGWTLIHEVLFYFIIAASLLVSRKALPVILTVWAVIIFIVAFPLPLSHAATDFWTLLTLPINLEFLMGAIAAWLFMTSAGRWAMPVLIIGLICFMASLVIGINFSAPNFYWQRIAMFGLPSAAILYGLVNLERSAKLNVPRLLTRLGDWSYSLYLCHLFVIILIRYVWQSVSPALPEPLQYLAVGPWDNIVYGLMCFPAAIMTSALSYTYIEKPLLKLFRQGFWRRSKKSSKSQ